MDKIGEKHIEIGQQENQQLTVISDFNANIGNIIKIVKQP